LIGLALVGQPLVFQSGCASSRPKEPKAEAVSAATRPPAQSACALNQVLIPGGTFLMGADDGDADERPVHQVTLLPYCIDKTEVTVAAYRACVQAGECRTREDECNQYCTWGREGFDQHPINFVDWYDANAYCKWTGGRLPSEAEWEYAARGNDGRRYPWGNQALTPDRANTFGDEDGWECTAPVGSYPQGASPFGLLDMAGNVAEWTADSYEEYGPDPVTNPQHPGTDKSRRVLRGESWSDYGRVRARAAERFRTSPGNLSSFFGFRCASAAKMRLVL
jgi:formylglycine-generating enzyme required for sulfatase activity